MSTTEQKHTHTPAQPYGEISRACIYQGSVKTACVYGDSHAEAAQRAALYAAAPELLAALIQCRDFLNDVARVDFGGVSELDWANDAIDKATKGQQS